MKIVNGWAFPDADEFMVKEMKEDGTYQRSHLDAAIKYVRRFSSAIDGGAHVGTWSRLLAPLFSKVLAFEPSADTNEALRYNMTAFRCWNVSIRQQALGAEHGSARMTLEGSEKAIATANTGARFVRPGKEVEVITIDSLKLEKLDFLKIDIEGSEANALRGARETLLRCRPVVLFEDKNLGARYGEARRAPHDVLASIGARQMERIGCDEIWGWA